MNKLLVSDSINLNAGCYILKAINKDLKIITNDNVKIYLLDENINKLDIILNDNSKVLVYMFNKNVNNNLVINIDEINNTELDFRYTFINNDNYKCIVNNNIKGNNNKSNINIRNVSNKELSKIIINVNIAKNTKDNIALEDLKGINYGGCVHIEPNIVCLSNEVSANHLTTIGGIDIDSLNYLMSKGIDIDSAKELLLKGFIYSNMDDYIKSVEVS